MQFVLLGLGFLALVLWGLPAFARASPARLADITRIAVGVVLIGAALLLLVRGQMHLSVPVLGAGLAVLSGKAGRWLGGGTKSAGQASTVRTAYLAMRLDHDSGAMTGDVLAGRFAGRRLDDLGMADLGDLLVECRAHDAKGLPVLKAYLDHRAPAWRERFGDDRQGGDAAGGSARAGPMTDQEARAILGVGPAAGADEIRSAWRELMKRNHPDQGGSAPIAARINEAKAVLLGRTG